MNSSRDESGAERVPLIASIVFNSLTHANIKGFRGPMESQQIIFQAEDLSIHLRVSKPDQERVILGQLLQQAPDSFIAGARISLLLESGKIGSTVTNSLGEFRFSAVPVGALTLEADISARRLIANFKVIGD